MFDKEYNINKSDVFNVDIDLRYETQGLTDEFAISLLYIRNCKFVKCKCFNDLNKTGDPDCPLCMGSGYFASLEKIRVIESGIQPYRSENFTIQQKIGTTDQKTEVYYIRHQYNPKERDFLMKVSWKNGKPIDVLKVFQIISVYEMRGDNGRLEVTGCVTDNRTDLVIPFSKILKKIPYKAINLLSKGEKTIWPGMIFTKKNKNL